jgi:hypothetical protein
VEVFGKIKQLLAGFLASLQTSARASEALPPEPWNAAAIGAYLNIFMNL